MHKYTENDCLILRAKNGHNALLAVAALFIGGGIANVIVGKEIRMLIISFLPLLILFRYWVATGRTIEMNREGCKISFLWYKKEYKWNELRYIKYENAEDTILWYKTAFVKWVIFSRKVIHKPKWISPPIYCMILHPLSVFFVHFQPDVDRLQERIPVVYCVKEEMFRRYLAEWGVEIQGDEKSNN